MTRLFLIALFALAIPAAHAEDLLAVTPGSGSNVGGKLATGGGFHTGNMVCDATDPRICGPVSATNGLAVQTPDGANVALGTTTDAAYAGGGTATVISGLKGLWSQLASVMPGNSIGTGLSSLNTIGAVGQANGDPCSSLTQSYAPISMTAATTTQIVVGVSAKKVYVCSLMLFAGASDNVAVIEGTGATCSGGTVAGVIGGTTTGAGLLFAASTGFTFGNGSTAIAQTAVDAQNLCLVTSTTGPLAGGIKYVVN